MSEHEVRFHSRSSWTESGREILGGGGTFGDVREAWVEVAARELLEGETCDGSWTVVSAEDDEGVDVREIEWDEIFECLVQDLGVNHYEALDLVEGASGLNQEYIVIGRVDGVWTATMAEGFPAQDGSCGTEVARANDFADLSEHLRLLGVVDRYIQGLQEKFGEE